MLLRPGREIFMDVRRCRWYPDKLELSGHVLYACNGLPMIGLHVCASIVHHNFYSYAASLSGPNDHSSIYTA